MSIQENRFDTLDDDSLASYLADEAARRRERLSIGKRGAGWIAETYQTDGLSSGRSVMFGATGPDRRTAMLGLAEKLLANRS
jgi:hypothetical protein